MKKVFLGILFLLFVISACTTAEPVEVSQEKVATTEPFSDWMTTPLEDVHTGEEFMISDFEGETVLVESFAVWCPTCTKQQKNIKEFHELYGELTVSVSLDTDPNEDKEAVLAHAEKNEFDWRYSVAPAGMAQLLIEEYGLTIVSAPSVPIIMVCPDGSTRLMTGLKDANKLKAEVEAGC
jgi:hypothetical protein